MARNCSPWPGLRGLRSVAHHQVEGAGRDLAEAAVAVERDGDADGGVVAREVEAAFEQAVVNLVDVQGLARLPENHRRGLRDRPVEEAVALDFDLRVDRRDVVARDDRMRREARARSPVALHRSLYLRV